jgi:hypothetical protein
LADVLADEGGRMTEATARLRRINGTVLAAGVVLGPMLYAVGVRLSLLVWFTVVVVVMILRPKAQAALLVDGRWFAAVAPVLETAGFAVWIAALTGEGLARLAGARSVDGVESGVTFAFAGLLAAAGGLAVWRPSFVALTPEGLVYRAFWRTRSAPWEELTDDHRTRRPDQAAPQAIHPRGRRACRGRLPGECDRALPAASGVPVRYRLGGGVPAARRGAARSGGGVRHGRRMNARWRNAGLLAAGAAVGTVWSLATRSPAMSSIIFAGFGLPFILRRDKRFAVGFTAVSSRWLYAVSGAAAAAAFGTAVAMLHDDAPQFAMMRRFESGIAVVYAVLGVVFSLLAVFELWRPPTVTLTPEGILRPLGLRMHLTRWEDLPGPIAVTGGWLQTAVVLDDPRRPVIPGWLTTDVAYIAAAVEHYRGNPEHRATIGNAVERERLDEALRSGA